MNALLNYVFALLEAEGILACQAVGLDPGLGIVHDDARARQSIALDIMEPVRPEVEGFVLDMIEGRTSRKAEFSETEDGHVRLRAPLTHEVAETMPQWARSLAPIAEKVANMLGHAMDGKYIPVTTLTSAKLRSAKAIVKARKTEAISRAGRDRAKQRPAASVALPLYSCPECGGPVSNPRHVLCWDLPSQRRPHCRCAPNPRPGHRRPQAGTQRAGRRLRRRRRPGRVPPAHLAQTGGDEARRHHGGHRLQQGALLDHPSGHLDTAGLDLDGACRSCRCQCPRSNALAR